MNITLVICCDRQKDGRVVLIQPVDGTNEVPRVLAIIKRTVAPEILADYDAYCLHIDRFRDVSGQSSVDKYIVDGRELSFDTLDFVR